MGWFGKSKAAGGSNSQGKYVVDFAGGMGAQILSAAVYFRALDDGEDVRANLTYFDRPQVMAEPGNPGVPTHWGWALDDFGLPKTAFNTDLNFTKREIKHTVPDGEEKFRLALEALKLPAVRARFAVSADLSGILPADFAGPFMCLHVRRGDYVNVASHLMSESTLIESAQNFAGLVRNVVVMSDSPITPEVRSALSTGFERVLYLDQLDAFSSHRVMRTARILVCSNSQFSLIAALLNPKALAILPKQWFGGSDRKIEAPIDLRCGFQVLSHPG